MAFAQAHTQPLVDLTFDPFNEHLLYAAMLRGLCVTF